MTAVFTTSGTHVDDAVSAFEDIEVMLYDYDCIATVDEPVEHTHQHIDVLEMQPCGWLVEDKERPPGVAACKLRGEFYALVFTTR